MLDGCKLASTRFDATDLRGADLRGNDVSAIAGVGSLRSAVIADEQLVGLMDALVKDPALTVKGG